MVVDQAVTDWVVGHRVPALTVVFQVITHLGGAVALAAATVVVVGVLVQRRCRSAAAWPAGSVLTGWLLMAVLKALVGRDRPPPADRLVHVASHSFPSGHAMMTAVFATAVIAAVLPMLSTVGAHRVLVCALVGYSLIVGLSRIYLGVHWLTDVLAGWVFGVVWAAAWVWMVTASARRGSGSLTPGRETSESM